MNQQTRPPAIDNAETFAEAWSNHRAFLLGIAYRLLGSYTDAEDVVQEVYVRAFLNLAAFRGESAFGTWLSRIVINEALGRLRRRPHAIEWSKIEDAQPGSGQVIPFPLAEQSDPERTMAQRELRSMLEHAIDDLPAAFRTVIVARVIEEMSIEKVIFSVDWPYVSNLKGREFLDAAPITNEQRRMIASENVRKLLKL